MVLVAAIGVHGEDILPDRGPICGKNGDLRAVRRSVWSDVIEVIHEQRLRFAAIYTEAIDPGLLEAEAACCEDQPSPVWVPAGMPLRPRQGGQPARGNRHAGMRMVEGGTRRGGCQMADWM